ncbi:ABI gene family member 3-like isoform X2 [Hyperolius riggenbachi]
MALVTQTLASVASQVSIAARHVSDMLEKQSQNLQKEEAKVRIISQLIDIHAEKVSRRKIGSLTISKKFPHNKKIVSVEEKGPLTPYARVPVNLSALDNIGHALTDSDTQQLSKTGTMSRQSVKRTGQIHNSLGRSCRLKDPVPPPLVPVSPDGISPTAPSFPSMNGELPLPPPPEIFEQCYPTVKPGPPVFHSSIPEYMEDCLPPPPVLEYSTVDTYCPTINVSSCPPDDFLPPPPPPGYDCQIVNLSNYDFSIPFLDDLPPPPEC